MKRTVKIAIFVAALVAVVWYFRDRISGMASAMWAKVKTTSSSSSSSPLGVSTPEILGTPDNMQPVTGPSEPGEAKKKPTSSSVAADYWSSKG